MSSAQIPPRIQPLGPRPRSDLVESPLRERDGTDPTIQASLDGRPTPWLGRQGGPQSQLTQGSQRGWWPFHPKQTGPQKEISKRRLRWWIAICAAFAVLAPVISIVMGVTLHSRDMEYVAPAGEPFAGRTIMFEAVLISADPKAGSMRMDWRILGEKNSPCRAENVGPCSNVNVFFDTNLLRPDGAHSTQEEILSSDPPTRPIFEFNATAFATKNRRSNIPTFRTQLALFSPDVGSASLMFYPFDSYLAEIIFFAQDAVTGASVGVEITATRGIAVGLETQFDHRGFENTPPELVAATVTLTRSTLVKSYCIVATIAIWAITMILVLVMVTSIWFGFKQQGEVLIIPVATLFAFTQLRQSMPGAPEGFGDILDLVGIVPCLAMLAIAAAFTLGAFILSDPTVESRQQIRWRTIRKLLPKLLEKDNQPAQATLSHPKIQPTVNDDPNTVSEP